MQISVKNVKQREDPYQLFIDSVKSDQTQRKYSNLLHRFLKLIPNELYQDSLDSQPKDKEITILASYFVKLAKKDAKMAQNIIITYIKEEKKLVESGELNPNTLPNHIKPIRALLDANSIPLHWKTIHKLYPRPKKTEDRAYSRKELQRMIEASPDITDKLIIQLFSSGGFRLESWDYFTWKDVVFFKNEDGSYKGAGLLVYRGDPESYWTFITPEACKTLEHYREVWKSDVAKYPQPDDPLIKSVKFPIVQRLNAIGVKRRVQRIVHTIGLRPPLPEGKKRHKVPLDHGFRKYFNTMMRRAKVNFLDKEDMMGHSIRLEKHYERYQEEDFERFSEYQKAIPFLTISDDERQKQIIQDKDLKISKLEKKEKRIEELEFMMRKKDDEIDDRIQMKTQEHTQKFLEDIKNFYEERLLESNKRLEEQDRKFVRMLDKDVDKEFVKSKKFKQMKKILYED